MTKLITITFLALAVSSCAFQGPSFRIGKTSDNSEQLKAVTAQLQQLTQKHNALVQALGQVRSQEGPQK